MNTIAYINNDVDKRINKHKYGNYLYHYTSIATLHNILKSKQFWLGNTATMNDKKEIKNFIELLQNALRDDVSADKLSQCDEFFIKVFERIKSEYPYAMCFSELDDDAAQWERYADNAEGICIVFNTKNIMRVFYETDILFQRVYYEFDIRQHKHYKILRDYFKTGERNGFSNENGQISNAIACGYFHKHRSFRSEKEIRVVTLWNHIPKYAMVETECVRGIVKKFLKFDMEKRCTEVGLTFENLFEGIVIGPKSAQDIGSLQSFVEEKGFASLKGKISKSDCPLR
ncbi:DUF2971 domain-containing protein [Lachnospiraceae bacterium 29-84]